MYTVGWPFWKLAYRSGLSLQLRVEVIHDAEAGVFVATSPNLAGLVAEASSPDELLAEVRSSALELIALATGEQQPKQSFYLKMPLVPA